MCLHTIYVLIIQSKNLMIITTAPDTYYLHKYNMLYTLYTVAILLCTISLYCIGMG